VRAGHLPALGSAAKSNRCDQRTETHHPKGAPAAEADPSGSNAAQAGTFPAFDDIPALPFIAGGLIGSVRTLLPAPLARALRNQLPHRLPHDYASALVSTLSAGANPSQIPK